MLRRIRQGTQKQTVDKCYQHNLSNLKPIASMKIDGVSLVVKYSKKNPNMLITPDATGNVYFVNTLDTYQVEEVEYPNIKEFDPQSYFQAHTCPIFDVDWHNNSTQIITGSADPSCGIWDVETGKNLYNGYTHTRSVRTVSSCQFNQNLFTSGGRDGQLLVWDCRTKEKPISPVQSPMEGEENVIEGQLIERGKEEIESFTSTSFYNDERTILSAQSNSKVVKVWDLRKIVNQQSKKKKIDKSNVNPALAMRIDKTLVQQQRINFIINEIHQFRNKLTKTKEDIQKIWQGRNSIAGFKNVLLKQYSSIKLLHEELKEFNTDEFVNEESKKGLSSLYIHPCQNKLLVTSTDHIHTLYPLDRLTKEYPKIFKGHKSSLYVRSIISPCQKYIASGSTDQSVKIWDAESDSVEPIITLNNGHHGEINCIDWSTLNSNFIATVGDDHQLLLWDYETNQN